jgi:dihydroneopterin aldolase
VPAASSLEITLAGMRFHARVGILPHEREVAQPLEIDLTVRRAEGRDPRRDPGRDTGRDAILDYRALYAIVREVVAAEPLDYLESVGGAIADGVLALAGVESVRVAVRKPHVALGGPLAYAAVVVERHA